MFKILQYPFIIIIALSISSTSPKKQQLLERPLIINSDLWYLSMELGSNSIKEKISQSKEFTWLTSNVFQRDNSNSLKTISSTNIKYDNKELQGEIVVDQLDFPQSKQILPDFYFKYVDEKYRDGHHGWFGFAYKFNDEKYSIIHQLYKSNLINHLSYAIVPNNQQGNGTFYFGGIPSNIIKDKHSATCNVENGLSSWGCVLSYVSIGSNHKYHYVNKHPSYFEADISNILVPKDFMEYLNNTALAHYTENKDCTYESMRKDNKYIVCSCDAVPYLPDLHFVFGSKNFTFNTPDLFEEAYEHCILKITYSEDNEDWIFGRLFLEKFYSLFDYEKKTVTFYSKNKFNEGYWGNANSNSTTKRAIIFMICFASLGVGFLLYIKTGLLKRNYY